MYNLCILLLVLFFSEASMPSKISNLDNKKIKTHIVKIPSAKYLFVFPDAKTRYIQLNYIDDEVAMEYKSQTDSFKFNDTLHYRNCGNYEFIVFDESKTNIEFKTNGRKCCS